jgi:hypothetical protein
MQYVCDGPDGKTWFRLEDEMEAELESEIMAHAVAKHFRRNLESAKRTYRPTSTVSFEQNIGLKPHLAKTMARFLTLRNQDGEALATAMLPPGGQDTPRFQCIIVGKGNSDPYTAHGAAIEALAGHYGLSLDRDHCFPYRR